MKRLHRSTITAAQYRAQATKTISEETLHRRVAVYLARTLRPPTIWTTIGHGGGGKMRGMRLKAMGVQPGWPDIIVLNGAAPWRPRVIGIELKARKGTQTPEQKAVEQSFTNAGAFYSVARSLDDVRDILEANGVPMHARLMTIAHSKTPSLGE